MSSLIIPNQKVDHPHCTFCNRQQPEVRHIIAAPGKRAHICNECVQVCVRLLRDRDKGAWVPPMSEFMRK